MDPASGETILGRVEPPETDFHIMYGWVFTNALMQARRRTSNPNDLMGGGGSPPGKTAPVE